MVLHVALTLSLHKSMDFQQSIADKQCSPFPIWCLMDVELIWKKKDKAK